MARAMATGLVAALMASMNGAPAALADQDAGQIVVECFTTIVRPVPEPTPTPDPNPVPGDGTRNVIIMAEGSNLSDATISVDGMPLATTHMGDGSMLTAEVQMVVGQTSTVTIGDGSQNIDFSVVVADATVDDLLAILDCLLHRALPAAEVEEFSHAGFYGWVLEHTAEIVADLEADKLRAAESHSRQVADRLAGESGRKVSELLATLGGAAYTAVADRIVQLRSRARQGEWDTIQAPTGIGSVQIEKRPNAAEAQVRIYRAGNPGYDGGLSAITRTLPRVDHEDVPCAPDHDVEVNVFAGPMDVRTSEAFEYHTVTQALQHRDVHGFAIVLELIPEGECHLQQIILEDHLVHRRGGQILTDVHMAPNPQAPQAAGPMMDGSLTIEFATPTQIEQHVNDFQNNPQGVSPQGFDAVRLPGSALVYFDAATVEVGGMQTAQANDIIDRTMRLRTYVFCPCGGQTTEPTATIDWEFTQQITVAGGNGTSTSNITAQAVSITRRGEGGLQSPAPNQPSPYEQDLTTAEGHGVFDPAVHYVP